MQLTIDSSTPRYVDWHNDGIVEFASSRAFVRYAELHMTLPNQVSITHLARIQQVVGFFGL